MYIAAIYVWTRPSTDPRWNTLEVLWSTERRFAKRARRASDDKLAGARWSTMYMERRGHDIWDPDVDPDGHATLERWAQEEDLWFDGARDGYGDALDDGRRGGTCAATRRGRDRRRAGPAHCLPDGDGGVGLGRRA